ncbi:MAG TPA: TolC family protein [Isosphaeraceae bacterium]|jgi:outer membrane protein TolC|nr:TolC family protein [Isosphaeraceae bacterium]
MRLTFLRNRFSLTATLMVLTAIAVGCRKTPYIDQSKQVPEAALETVADEDKEVREANFTSNLPVPMPRIAPPRTTENPEAAEVWYLTLPDAITIALDHAEVVRVIALGAQGIPIGGFEPSPLNIGAGAGVASALGAQTLTSVYDPAIQESQISQALSVFDANFQTSLLWGRNVQPFNNAISAGTFTTARFPVIFNQDTAQYTAQMQKRAATGTLMTVAHNINWLYSNSPINVQPSAYTTNTQMSITQPLLGGTAQNPSGLEANRAPIVIARVNADAAVWRFKASVMQLVRSVEQQYWALSQQQVQLWSRETAVSLGDEILKRELAELEVGRGTTADVAEARQRLENFKLQLVTATSDVITTERQLRNILGLPPADNRRIVPVTAPSEARVEPDWDSSLAQMISFQPDIVQAQLLVRLAELQLLVARNQLLPVLNLNALYQFNGLGHSLDKAESVMTGADLRAIDPLLSNQQHAAGLNALPGMYKDFQTWQVGFTFQMPLGFRNALATTRAAQYTLLRQRAFVQQIVHQTVHSLARFFLEVDANYKQYKTASRLRAAAEERLAAQQADYEVGRITIDRYLEAVSEWANAVAQEAQFKTSYNTSIVALEEAKGTLLAYDNIAVAEGPQPHRAYVQARDQQNAHRRFPLPGDGPYHPQPVVGPAMPDPIPPATVPDQPPPGPLPPFPAPIGPLGPLPTPTAPEVPVGEPNFLSQRDQTRAPEPNVVQASRIGPAGDAPVPGAASGELPPLPGSPAQETAPAPEIPIDLPPLPAEPK